MGRIGPVGKRPSAELPVPPKAWLALLSFLPCVVPSELHSLRSVTYEDLVLKVGQSPLAAFVCL